jgi:sugar phosphate permease
MTRGVEDRILRARTPLAYHVLPKRFFYGWYIAVAASVLMLITIGVGYYGLAVFLRPLQEEHGWSNTVVSGATSFYFVVSGVSGAIIGPHVDRRGPIPFLIAGVASIFVAMLLLGRIDAIWQLFAVYSILAFGYGLGSSVTLNAVMTRWFVERRALAISIASTGISLGGMFIAPIGAWLIGVGGIQLAAPVLGVIALVIPLPIVLLVLVFDPRQMGLRPDGDSADGASTRPRRLDQAAQMRVWTIAEATRTVSFWAVLIAFVLVLLSQTGFVIHQIAFLEDRLGSRSQAALTLSMTAFGSTFARVLVGLFADRMDKRRLTATLFAMQAASVLLLLNVDSTWATFALTLVFGFTLGNVYMLQSLLVGEIFGMMSFAAVFGLIVLAGQLGSGVGPLLIGWLEQQTGGYDIALTTTASLTFLAAIIVMFARPIPAAPEPAPAPAQLEVPGS